MFYRLKQFWNRLDRVREPLTGALRPLLPYILAAAILFLGLSAYTDYRLATRFDIPIDWTYYALIVVLGLTPLAFRWVYGTTREEGPSLEEE